MLVGKLTKKFDDVEECQDLRTSNQPMVTVGAEEMECENQIGLAEGSQNLSNSNGTILSACFALMESSSDSESESYEYRNPILEVRKAKREEYRLVKELCVLLERKSRNCIKKYLEEIMPSYTEGEFCRHFSVSRTLYNSICERFAGSDVYKNLRNDKRYSTKLHIAVFLWFAGHEACSYNDLSDRFDISTGTVCYIIHQVTLFLSSLSPQTIKWPNAQKMLQSSRFFQGKCDFSKAIGCIDGTHIIIDPPKSSKDDYIDRKGNTSLCLQGVCDENKKCLSIFVGYLGSSHDRWVFQNSPIYNKLASVRGEYYLLGDSAYPCSSHCVTPYRDNGHLTREQKTFNVRLSRGRVAIEHTFGILKLRFRQLYYCKMRGIKNLFHFIRACCVLHNLANASDLEFDTEAAPESIDEYAEHGIVAARGNVVRDTILREMTK